MILDPKMRNLVWYMYKSVMRWVTGIFVTIDPVGILKSYVDSLQDNLGKMSKQIGNLQGQMRSMQNLMEGNKREIDASMKLASQAKIQNNEPQIVLHTRKAARLQESNEKYNNLFKRMELLKKVLSKMYENSEILLEDTKDQVKVKEQERQAIRTSHSAMKSAMNILSGSPDQRMMFDMAMENINNDVAMKVGEMERFMEMSSGFMNSIDLQNGVFEEEGLKMLDDWEKKSALMLTGGKITADDKLELKAPPTKEKSSGSSSSSGDSYDSLFK
jgi:predicted  nucleic acid-binding Zn-ribbon protein